MKEEDREWRRTERDRLYQKEKSKEKMSRGTDGGIGGSEESKRGRRAEDDDIDYVLDPVFASFAISLLPNPRGWDKMAAGRTSRPGRVYVS